MLALTVALGFSSAQTPQSGITLHIKTPMSPPSWALLERNCSVTTRLAVERFAGKYVDERGYLLHTPRWGTLDGPDDAIETFWNWTLLHALGGSDSVLDLYKKAQEGHWKQYGELRTKLTELAANGAYSKEFVTQSDWFHTGEGMRAFALLGLSEPNNEHYRAAHPAASPRCTSARTRKRPTTTRQQGTQEYLDRQQRSHDAQSDHL